MWKNEGEMFWNLALYHSAHSWRRWQFVAATENDSRFALTRNRLFLGLTIQLRHTNLAHFPSARNGSSINALKNRKPLQLFLVFNSGRYLSISLSIVIAG